MPVILALRRLRWENLEFQARQRYTARPCLKALKKQGKQTISPENKQTQTQLCKIQPSLWGGQP
jgi:hypothetical protein